MQPKVIVMMATYNGEKYLERQLESIYVQQRDCNIELFVRDDGSSDNTMKILHKWEEKINISYVEDSISLGAAKSFWKIMTQAPDADYYAFVDQDDIWDDKKIITAIQAIGNTEEPILWFSNCRLIDESENVIEEKKHNVIPIVTVASQLVCGSSQGCAMVFNRSALDIVRSKNVDYVPMHDIVFMIYLIAMGKVLYEETPLFSYRVHSNNVVAKKGKSFIKRTKDSLKQWFGKGNKYAISKFAIQILKDVGENLDEDTKEYLQLIVGCRRNISYRNKIINSKLTKTNNISALKSFKMRVFLGII